LVTLVEAQIGEHPVDLLAQSMGGWVAMVVTLRNPAKVRRLVLSVTSVGVDMAALDGADWRQTYRQKHPNAAAWVLDRPPLLTTRLSGVAQPALLLWGDADPISPVEVGQHLEDLLPHATLQVVQGGEHDLVATDADLVAPLIEAHLD
jgi:pimeloyl-ACP methyl ester carboxylesterase